MKNNTVKSICVAFLVVGISFSLVGCGRPHDKNSYFEKNNLKTTTRTTYKVPVKINNYVYGTKDGWYMTYVEWNLKDKYKTKIESMDTKKSDKDGYMTTTVVASCVIPVGGRFKQEVGISFDYTITTYDFFDYYTGMSFPFTPTDSQEIQEGSEIISYNGNEYDISYTKQNIWSIDEKIDWTQTEFEGVERCTTTFTFTYPNEYDGLMGLYAIQRDDREYDERCADMEKYENVPREILSPEYLGNIDLENVRFFRVR